MIFRGFRFGMLLQLAVGPVCIFTFQLAVLNGFFSAEAGVLGVALADGLFILLAILGVAALIKKEKVRFALKIFGAVVLFIFGLSMVLGAFGIGLLPGIGLAEAADTGSSFFRALVLTISNPLTILFWSGVFSTKIVSGDMKPKDIYLYGLGALLSTLVFLTAVALSGNLVKPLFTTVAGMALNIAVGLLLIFFSFRLLRDNKGKSPA